MKDNKSFGIKVVLALFLLMFFAYGISRLNEETEQKIVKEQVEAIQGKRLTEAYYAFTSKEFQEATSLDDFKKFIGNFPLFTENTAVIFERSKPGTLDMTLKSENEEMHVIYSLSKEDKKWRVRGIEVAKEEHELKDVPEFDTTIFLAPVKQHIEALHEGKNQSAYKDTTSDDFRETTTFEEFEAFLKTFPIFGNFEKVDYYKLSFNNNLGQYHVKLIGDNQETYEVQYDLIKEEGKWKILQIQISDTPK